MRDNQGFRIKLGPFFGFKRMFLRLKWRFKGVNDMGHEFTEKWGQGLLSDYNSTLACVI